MINEIDRLMAGLAILRTKAESVSTFNSQEALIVYLSGPTSPDETNMLQGLGWDVSDEAACFR